MRNQELFAAVAGLEVIGVVVSYAGRVIELSGREGDWEASTFVTPTSVEEHDVQGFGKTALDALRECAEEADAVEQDDVSDDDLDVDD